MRLVRGHIPPKSQVFSSGHGDQYVMLSNCAWCARTPPREAQLGPSQPGLSIYKYKLTSWPVCSGDKYRRQVDSAFAGRPTHQTSPAENHQGHPTKRPKMHSANPLLILGRPPRQLFQHISPFLSKRAVEIPRVVSVFPNEAHLLHPSSPPIPHITTITTCHRTKSPAPIADADATE